LSGWTVAAAVLLAAGCQSALGGDPVCPTVVYACPETIPLEGTPCTGSSQIWCEYGSDPSYQCDTIAFCDPQSGWLVQAVSDPSCPTANAFECPPTLAAASYSATVCTSSAICRYPEGQCVCAQDGASLQCNGPAAGCPATRPRAGMPCDASACRTWGTGICDGQSMTCRCGIWQPVLCYD
jgi:hypothetical protein